MLRRNCPECGKALKVKDDAVGKKVRCPACKHVFHIQAQDAASAMRVGEAGIEQEPPQDVGQLDEQTKRGTHLGAANAPAKKNYGKACCFLAAGLALHLVFCEWHFSDTTTGAYNIIEFSRKPHPFLGDNPSYGALYDVVNGLFARNFEPAIGAADGQWQHAGTAAGGGRSWVLTATIFGVIIPIPLLVLGSHALLTALRRSHTR